MNELKRLKRSFFYGFKGIKKIWLNEKNFRIEFFIAVLVIILALFLKVEKTDFAILFLTIGFVLVVEAINSAIEIISDFLKPKLNNYIKEIKDVMSASVILASLISIFVGILVFSKYLL
jgi:diacylglycerol kinase